MPSFLPSFTLSMIAQRAGQVVKACRHDRPTAEAMVIPNCVKNVPDVPEIKVTGMNTAMKTSVHENTAIDTSFMAWRVASLGSLIPPSNFAITVSTTTMESSTTVPMANTSANSVSRFSEKPAKVTIMKVPISDTITEIDGMMVALIFCRKKNTTKITRMMAMINVSTTLWIAAKRKSSAFIKVTNSSPAGIVAFISSHIWSMRWFTSVALEPGDWKTSMKVPG